jgi:hypothetical protein
VICNQENVFNDFFRPFHTNSDNKIMDFFFFFFCRLEKKMTEVNDKLASPGNHQYATENPESEDKIVQEFSQLLEKSKQLFNGLR